MYKDYLKTFPQYLIPKQGLTRFAGLMANVKNPAIKNHLIRNFIAKYDVNMQEAEYEDPTHYSCFNEFFIRSLKSGVRPIAQTDIVSPVDGIVSEAGKISAGQIVQAKGRYYTVDDFLACDRSLSHQFMDGCFATLYLSPKDYHRVHMPVAGRLRHMVYVPGKLFSVQPTTARVVPQLFARNERLIAFFDTPVGLMAMGLVGATIVGAIGTSWGGDIVRNKAKQTFTSQQAIELQKGAEMGYFKLGSTVVLLFADGNSIRFADQISAGKSIKYGEAFGTSLNQSDWYREEDSNLHGVAPTST